jgi:hypothetical protein
MARMFTIDLLTDEVERKAHLLYQHGLDRRNEERIDQGRNVVLGAISLLGGKLEGVAFDDGEFLSQVVGLAGHVELLVRSQVFGKQVQEANIGGSNFFHDGAPEKEAPHEEGLDLQWQLISARCGAPA